MVCVSYVTSSETNSNLRYVSHGIFAAGGLCPHEKKKIWMCSALGGSLCPHKKKNFSDLKKLANIKKVLKFHRIIASCPVPSTLFP